MGLRRILLLVLLLRLLGGDVGTVAGTGGVGRWGRRESQLLFLLQMLLLLPDLYGALVGELLLQGEEESHEVSHGGANRGSLLLLGEAGQVQDVAGRGSRRCHGCGCGCGGNFASSVALATQVRWAATSPPARAEISSSSARYPFFCRRILVTAAS